jgi:hypothetical protein
MRISHLVGGLVGFAVTGTASAAIVVTTYEGGLEIARNPLGIYLDIETGAWGNSPSTSPEGWDVQVYGTGALNFLAPEGYRFVRTSNASLSSGPSVLASGYEIASSMSDATWIAGGSAAGLTDNSDQNYIGFRFVAATGDTHYGWMRFAVQGDAATGTRRLLAFGYQDAAGVSIAAGAIPAPGAIAVLGLAAARRTRRRA